YSAQAATNGIHFAQDADYAMAAAKAGLRIAYLQFDGVGEDANAHRKVGNLFEVKLRAIENLHRAGVDIALVVTIVRTVNDDQVRQPPELRHRDGAARQQEDEAVGAAAGGLRRRTFLRRCADDRRRGARTVSHEAANCLERPSQLSAIARAGRIPPLRSDQEVRQAKRWRARRRRRSRRWQPQVR